MMDQLHQGVTWGEPEGGKSKELKTGRLLFRTDCDCFLASAAPYSGLLRALESRTLSGIYTFSTVNVSLFLGERDRRQWTSKSGSISTGRPTNRMLKILHSWFSTQET
jgi:hypothetical protein